MYLSNPMQNIEGVQPEEMSYFVVVDLGYDGTVVTLFENQEEAEKDYADNAGDIERDDEGDVVDTSRVFGVALIEGKLIKEVEQTIRRAN